MVNTQFHKKHYLYDSLMWCICLKKHNGMQAEYKGFLRMFVPYRSQSKKHSEIYDVVFGLPWHTQYYMKDHC